jgi:hypothetical protein
MAISPLCASARMARSMSLMIDGWMPSVGSSRISSFGPIASARPIASCCCWPPERSPPRRRSIWRSTGNISKIRSGTGVPPGQVGQPHQQILLHGQARKDLASLRHVADAGLDPLVRRGTRQVAAGKLDAAALRRQQTHQRLEQRRLADAVAAENRRHLARLGGEAEVAQDVAAAVILVQVVDTQHGRPNAPDRLR